jgi:hypothetical protein
VLQLFRFECLAIVAIVFHYAFAIIFVFRDDLMTLSIPKNAVKSCSRKNLFQCEHLCV